MRLGTEGISVILRRNRLQWFGHVERREHWVKKCQKVEVEGQRQVGRSLWYHPEEHPQTPACPKLIGTGCCWSTTQLPYSQQ